MTRLFDYFCFFCCMSFFVRKSHWDRFLRRHRFALILVRFDYLGDSGLMQLRVLLFEKTVAVRSTNCTLQSCLQKRGPQVDWELFECCFWLPFLEFEWVSSTCGHWSFGIVNFLLNTVGLKFWKSGKNNVIIRLGAIIRFPGASAGRFTSWKRGQTVFVPRTTTFNNRFLKLPPRTIGAESAMYFYSLSNLFQVANKQLGEFPLCL
jgi:hypothetical protein